MMLHGALCADFGQCRLSSAVVDISQDLWTMFCFLYIFIFELYISIFELEAIQASRLRPSRPLGAQAMWPMQQWLDSVLAYG